MATYLCMYFVSIYYFKTQLSKDVKKLREFEQTLLTNYTQYLSILEETIQGNYYIVKQ